MTVDDWGDKRWRNENGQLHRLDGPAVVLADGSKRWFINGKLHRLDGPACEYTNGGKSWWVNGKPHRLDGPAREWSNGDKAWWIEGREYTEEEFNLITRKKPMKKVKEINFYNEIDTLTVKDLKDLLNQCDDSLPVFVADDEEVKPSSSKFLISEVFKGCGCVIINSCGEF